MTTTAPTTSSSTTTASTGTSPDRVRPPGRRRARLRGAAHAVVGVTLATLVVGVVVGAGARVTQAETFAAAPPAPADGWPSAATAPADGEVVVAVVVGRTGTVASDVLAPYEVFASSPSFAVYTVAEATDPVPLTGGTSLVPAHTFADVDAGLVARPDVVVVPAVSDPAGAAEAALRSWVVRQSAEGAQVIGVCSGSEVLAASGLLDGRRATSHWSGPSSLREAHPDVEWVGGQRWVADDGVTTTAGVSSGIPGALELVRRLAGGDEADRVGRALAYPGWELGGSTAIPEQRFTVGDLPLALGNVLPWLRPTVGIGLTDGVGEIDLAAVLEVYSMSAAARTVAVAATPAVTTRHGLVLTTSSRPGPTGIDRVVVPGAGGVDPALRGWADDHALEVEPVGAVDGAAGFDAALGHLDDHAGAGTARSAAKMLDYPTSHLRLTGAPDLRAPGLAAMTLVAAVGAGLLPVAIHRARRRRSARA